jgi:hypothetical protein
MEIGDMNEEKTEPQAQEKQFHKITKAIDGLRPTRQP